MARSLGLLYSVPILHLSIITLIYYFILAVLVRTCWIQRLSMSFLFFIVALNGTCSHVSANIDKFLKQSAVKQN